jgi:hypothetical protein
VTLDVRARKLVYDSAGVEREVPMDEWVPVGVFAAPRPAPGRWARRCHCACTASAPGAQTITVTVPRRPPSRASTRTTCSTGRSATTTTTSPRSGRAGTGAAGDR